MTEPTNGLRAARTARGWSQSRAAREIAALGRARGTPVASPASLKSLLSRWENGHSVPEPQYRALLGELFEHTSGELGIDDATDRGGGAGRAGDGAGRLRSALGAASAVDGSVLALWRQQLDVARRLDDELGTAGAGALVSAQVHQLDHTLEHTITAAGRGAVAAILSGAAELAGAQALDQGDHDRAWRYYGRAGSAAREAALPAAAAAALAGQATVLVDVGDPGAALTLLGEERPPGPPAAIVRWEAARGLARAAAGEGAAARSAFASARHTLDGDTPARSTRQRGARRQDSRQQDARQQDARPQDSGQQDSSQQDSRHQFRIDAAVRAEPAVELVDLHRWHGWALVTLGQADARTPLEQAMAARPRSVRHRAGLHADLAVALGPAHPAEAADHARQARALATRIGSTRVVARLSRFRPRS